MDKSVSAVVLLEAAKCLSAIIEQQPKMRFSKCFARLNPSHQSVITKAVAEKTWSFQLLTSGAQAALLEQQKRGFQEQQNAKQSAHEAKIKSREARKANRARARQDKQLANYVAKRRTASDKIVAQMLRPTSFSSKQKTIKLSEAVHRQGVKPRPMSLKRTMFHIAPMLEN